MWKEDKSGNVTKVKDIVSEGLNSVERSPEEVSSHAQVQVSEGLNSVESCMGEFLPIRYYAFQKD